MTGEQRSVDLTLEQDGVAVRIQVDIRPFANPRMAVALLDSLRSDLGALVARGTADTDSAA